MQASKKLEIWKWRICQKLRIFADIRADIVTDVVEVLNKASLNSKHKIEF